MVITSVYGYIDKQTDGIDRHRIGIRMEIWGREQGKERFTLFAYLSGLVRLVRFTLVHFGLFRLSD